MKRGLDYTADEVVMIAKLVKDQEHLAEDLGRSFGSVNRKVCEVAQIGNSLRSNALSAVVRRWVNRTPASQVDAVYRSLLAKRAANRHAEATSEAYDVLGT